jgi:hypothetical protein
MSDWQAILNQSKPLKDLAFPPVCPRCLTEEDLTTYQIGSKQDQTEIPICRACKGTLLRKERRTQIGITAFWVVACWGLLAYLIVSDLLADLIVRIGFPWGFLPPLVLIGTPFVSLYRVVFPKRSAGWPMWLIKTTGGGEIFSHTIGFMNEAYVRKFATANLPLLWDLTDWSTTPPNKLIHPRKGVVDPSLKKQGEGK